MIRDILFIAFIVIVALIFQIMTILYTRPYLAFGGESLLLIGVIAWAIYEVIKLIEEKRLQDGTENTDIR